MAIKSTKKVLASILSLAVFSQSFCGAIKNFMENKDDPRRSIVIKKEKPTGFDKIKEFAKKATLKPTPDNMGYFGYNSEYNCYIEVISFDKILADAKNEIGFYSKNWGLNNKYRSYSAYSIL